MAKPAKIQNVASDVLKIKCSSRTGRPPQYQRRHATLLVMACLMILTFIEFAKAQRSTLDSSKIGACNIRENLECRKDSTLNYFPVSGSVWVSIFGQFPLSSIGTPISRVGNSAFEATAFTSETALLCKSPAGQQKSMTFHF